jgi:hypothetical protein
VFSFARKFLLSELQQGKFNEARGLQFDDKDVFTLTLQIG